MGWSLRIHAVCSNDSRLESRNPPPWPWRNSEFDSCVLGAVILAQAEESNDKPPAPHVRHQLSKALLPGAKQLTAVAVHGAERIEGLQPEASQRHQNSVRQQLRKHNSDMRDQGFRLHVSQRAFNKVAKEVLKDLAPHKDFRLHPQALLCLHHALEGAVSEVFRDSTVLAGHAKRVTIFPDDMRTGLYLRSLHGDPLVRNMRTLQHPYAEEAHAALVSAAFIAELSVLAFGAHLQGRSRSRRRAWRPGLSRS